MIYLILAIWGAGQRILAWFGSYTDLAPGPRALFISASSIEHYIIALALFTFICGEVYVRKDYWVLLCIPVTLVFGFACGFPLYLFLRARPIN